MGLQQKTLPGLRESHQVGRQRVPVLLGSHQRIEVDKAIFTPSVERLQVDRASFAGRDLASGKNADRHVHGDGSGVKQVQRPEIKRGTRQISAARGLGKYLITAGW